MKRFALPLLLSLLAACASTRETPPRETAAEDVVVRAPERPLPHPLPIPPEYREAVEAGTRSETGAPGPGYWQQWAEYDLLVELDPDARRLDGTTAITYHNRSPDTLSTLWVHLVQNLHAPGVVRNEPAEVTGGVELVRVTVDGDDLGETEGDDPGYHVFGTRMRIVPPAPIPPGGTADLVFDYGLTIPQAGASGRMGYSGDDLFYLAYFYPQMAVYDDVGGWHADPFLGNAEFYAGFASYDVRIEAPSEWLVVATGRLQNPGRTLSDSVAARVQAAGASDEVLPVVTPANFGRLATWEDAGETITWHFAADSVRDVAASVTRTSHWDATRTPVGDRDGDGRTDYALVNAIYRESAPLWKEAARYAQHAIAFLSDYTATPYPWPHMTAVEGGGIIGGGMEFPMMTLIGDYNERGARALYYVVAHELAHMWIPMIASNNERRYAWMDEGTTTFNENRAREDFFPEEDSDAGDREDYLRLARTGAEGEILRWSDFHYPGAYGVASYDKPAMVLRALRGVLGEETFMRAYQAFWDRWAFRHPYPWDLFRTFEDVAGRDLEWFWSSWYQETWTLDQAIAGVRRFDDGHAEVEIVDEGLVPIPVDLVVTRADGSTERHTVPVDVWLDGQTRTHVFVPAGSPVVRAEIDPEIDFPDVDRSNNVWTAEGAAR